MSTPPDEFCFTKICRDLHLTSNHPIDKDELLKFISPYPYHSLNGFKFDFSWDHAKTTLVNGEYIFDGALKIDITLNFDDFLNDPMSSLTTYVSQAGSPKDGVATICDNCGCLNPDVYDDGARSRATTCCRSAGDWGKRFAVNIDELSIYLASRDKVRADKPHLAKAPLSMDGKTVPRPPPSQG
jgi:hypothetical protein